MSFTVTRCDLPAYKFCGYCGSADMFMTTHPEGEYIIIVYCASCFIPAAVDTLAAHAAAWLDKDSFKPHLHEIMGATYNAVDPNTDVATRIMAKILGGKQ